MNYLTKSRLQSKPLGANINTFCSTLFSCWFLEITCVSNSETTFKAGKLCTHCQCEGKKHYR